MTPRKNSYSQEEILSCGRGELFENPFPRLPQPNMLMIDRVTSVTEDGGRYDKGQIVAELDINPDQWFFHCHFADDPVMPGCLGLDAMWQLVGFYLAWKGHVGKGRALGVKQVKFTGQVLPTAKKVVYEIDIKRIMATKLVMALADGRLLVDGRHVYSTEGLKVGLFTSTDGF